MNGRAIHITGIVQGVGFRPWVWKTATELAARGWVRNDLDGVRVELFGDVEAFLRALNENPPPLSRIDSIVVSAATTTESVDFRILESSGAGAASQAISPDIALCDDCRRELFDPADRRDRYPFINCVNCGPRFSIMESLPYDRPNTSMRAFEMCAACRAEYVDPSSRRHHAQPIACPACGPRVTPAHWEAVWTRAMEEGKIVAIKGVGGFHLACDALNPTAVAALRNRKAREAKPFALMIPDLAWVRSVCHVTSAEERLLLSRERPIVLLKIKERFAAFESIAPGLNTLGVMLPYSPMHELLFDLFRGPVVMTSANHSSEPMIHENAAALKKLADVADVFITHDRAIVNRCDDSVCAVFGEQTIAIRPGRGIAPLDVPAGHDQTILAVGADLKNTFALSRCGRTELHPFIGDLAHPETEAILERSIAHRLGAFRARPDLIVHDLHPDYRSSALARRLAAAWGVDALGVQHHHAHLVGAHAGAAIGFAFDGTGYGLDGTIWGGEVLLYDALGFDRAFHLRPFALPGGDAAVRQPRRALEALLHQIGAATDPAVAAQIDAGLNAPMTSSMGRLFDAVAVLLGASDCPTYDGEAAMRLEAMADADEAGALAFEISDGEIDWRPMLKELVADLDAGVVPAVLAARFHNTVAEMVYGCGQRLSVANPGRPWVFAGGVFQNRSLVARIKKIVGDEFELIFSSHPNDSGIALGQSVIGAKQWVSR